MTEHIYERHVNCHTENCIICDGGLSICTVCGCIEASLPTHCPGFNCWATHGQAIYKGEIDFVNGKWIKPHRWVLTSPGDYDSTCRCSNCGKVHTTSIDNPDSKLPEHEECRG